MHSFSGLGKGGGKVSGTVKRVAFELSGSFQYIASRHSNPRLRFASFTAVLSILTGASARIYSRPPGLSSTIFRRGSTTTARKRVILAQGLLMVAKTEVGRQV
jgi:hypothetical protein